MLIEMKSPAFRKQGEERPPIHFKEGLNVVLGKEDGAMSIGKSSSLLAIDFVFGGDTYIKSDGVKKEGHHTIFFTFEFDGEKFFFARNTGDSNTIFICDKNYELTGGQYTKEEYTTWLKKKYHLDFVGLSFRIALSSFFRIYGKKNTDELNPLQGIPGQNMDKSISSIVALFDRFKDIEEFKANVTNWMHTRKPEGISLFQILSGDRKSTRRTLLSSATWSCSLLRLWRRLKKDIPRKKLNSIRKRLL